MPAVESDEQDSACRRKCIPVATSQKGKVKNLSVRDDVYERSAPLLPCRSEGASLR